MFRKTGDIGRPTRMLAYRWKISFVAKSITFGAKLPHLLMQTHQAAFKFTLFFSHLEETRRSDLRMSQRFACMSYAFPVTFPELQRDK
jgi:hypothetical protein